MNWSSSTLYKEYLSIVNRRVSDYKSEHTHFSYDAAIK